MRRTLIHLLLSATALGAPARASAADGPELTPLTDPALFVSPGAGVPVGVGFYRPNRLDVWQYYGVDRSGRFRPRVALTPEGAFYLYNGAPYPWLTVRPLDFITYILD
jgi:hypothetical protein